ncbi:MAG: transporter associated domain-containing protein, partial [Planctomycetota bacterium]
EIGVGLEADDDDHLTIGGMLADELDRVPEPGDALSYRGVTFEVAEATPKEVVRVDVVVPKREGRQ